MQHARFKLHAEERTCNPVQRPDFGFLRRRNLLFPSECTPDCAHACDYFGFLFWFLRTFAPPTKSGAHDFVVLHSSTKLNHAKNHKAHPAHMGNM